MNQTLKNRYLGCLLGLACGDAVGAAVEFKQRGSFPAVTGMSGGGPFGLRPGEWTDDTAMALCLAESLLERRGFDARDQMERYHLWRTTGHLSSNGKCFDIGTTVVSALKSFRSTGNPYAGSTDAWSAGNGCIMRMAPVVLFFFPVREQVIRFAVESSRTTHGTAECLDACRILAAILTDLLDARPRDEWLEARRWGHVLQSIASPRLQEIAKRNYRNKERDDIHGSGYVVDSLEAALWCFERTHSFREAVLAAANLGDDADTTAAVCGQIAGAHYGIENVPEEWLAILARRTLIEDFAGKLFANARQQKLET